MGKDAPRCRRGKALVRAGARRDDARCAVGWLGRGLLRAEDSRWAARAVATRGESLLQLLQGQRRLGGVYDHPRRPLRRHRQLASLWPLTWAWRWRLPKGSNAHTTQTSKGMSLD